MKKILLLFISLFIFCGCTKELSLTDQIKEMNQDEYIIIDVRTEEEFNESHVLGSINIPYDEIEARYTEIDSTKKIYVYCKSGGRSSIAYETLKGLNFDVYDLGAFENIDLIKGTEE